MTPYLPALVGGALIGLAAVMLMGLLGRIAGISGIVGGLLPPVPAADRDWRLAFVAGLVAAPLVLAAVTGRNWVGEPVAGAVQIVAAGLLVGVGVAIGGGCTSGHGVCGVARLSPRSLVATAVFMAVGIVVATFLRPVWGG